MLTAETINENAGSAAAAAQKPRAIEEDFFDMLTKSQSKRMDDQRCSLKVLGRSATIDAAPSVVRKPLAQQNSIPVASAAASKLENRYANDLMLSFLHRGLLTHPIIVHAVMLCSR